MDAINSWVRCWLQRWDLSWHSLPCGATAAGRSTSELACLHNLVYEQAYTMAVPNKQGGIMKRVAVLVLLMFGAAAAAPAQMGGKDADTEKKIIEMEKQLWQAWQDKKGQPFRDMLTKDTVGVSPMGLMRGAEATAAEIEKGECAVNSWAIHDPKVDWIDKNTALLTYHAVQDATCGGQKVPEAIWASSLWVKQKNKWLAAFHQESPDMTKMAEAKQ